MRKLIFAINTTLDGCVDHTKLVGSDDVLEFHARFLRATTGVQIFGRKTYELMVPYWPDAAKKPAETGPSREFAQAFAAVPKVVFSRTLISVEDPNTRIVRDNLQDAILRLKEEQGKSILVGGVDLASQLIELGLVDEFLFVVQPIVAGEGRRLLDGVSLAEKLKLKLVESTVLKSGCVALHYAKH